MKSVNLLTFWDHTDVIYSFTHTPPMYLYVPADFPSLLYTDLNPSFTTMVVGVLSISTPAPMVTEVISLEEMPSGQYLLHRLEYWLRLVYCKRKRIFQ
jgi:hypothetical protein